MDCIYKKVESLPGFAPGLLVQNAIALPLEPPPLPCHELCSNNESLNSGRGGGGAAWHRGIKLASHPAAPGTILAFPRILLLMLLRFIDCTAKNSGQRLDNVN